ncbi:BMC domain-containing protein [Providencia stuartii]|uniref:BMC domain-containing protein n=1 Tax=Providencia stuartii TaxID=588 RepID=A0AAJ1JE25_PROST|nr:MULTISPECIES: BMC domain-containing protein [Providencia]EMA3640623.1 BMC domain-containing protein [Providencia stuartii]MBW3102213.1 BMC domain-containing protein [Providencia stuartii]MCB5215691.1 BMC domain-containing protein [Providencia stuartii]MDE5308640.1 BMC domain-containing protein [Providencia stuartii]MDE8749503.1 BMC domain-containing protein [Providencia thailandensis]
MIDSLGLLEVYGLVSGIDAADAMLKSANVRILNYEMVIPGMVTLVVEGDLAACRAAIDSGVAAASRSGKVIGHKVIGRPDGDTEWLVTGFSGVPVKIKPQSSTPVAEPAVVPMEVPTMLPDADAMMTFIAGAKHRYGVTAGEAALNFNCLIEESRNVLENLLKQGKLRKRGSRYQVKREGNRDE